MDEQKKPDGKIAEVVYWCAEWNAGGPDPEVGREVRVTFIRPAGGGEGASHEIWQAIVDADIPASEVLTCEGESESLREEWRLIRASDYPDESLARAIRETWVSAHAAEEDVRQALVVAGWTVRRLGQRS